MRAILESDEYKNKKRGSKKKNIIDVSCEKTQETQSYSLFCRMNNIT